MDIPKNNLFSKGGAKYLEDRLLWKIILVCKATEPIGIVKTHEFVKANVGSHTESGGTTT